jgi:hypothetical protein
MAREVPERTMWLVVGLDVSNFGEIAPGALPP